MDETLAAIQSAPAFLHFSTELGIDLWSSHKIHIRTRRALRKHQAEITAMMLAGDTRTCPARDLHRRHWRHGGTQQYVCEVCAQIAANGPY